jgi:serine/threonine-protein kinase
MRDRLDREGQLPVEESVQITRDVAAALSYAHSNDVIHRDIKPENILLSGGEAVVADFGIARAISEASEERLTETGLAVGTPAYMSPEQAMGERLVDGRSDIYSLGSVLYEMLAGEPPYTGPTAQAIMARKLSEPVPPLQSVRDTIPPPIEYVVRKALARVPADRFQTAAQFSDTLGRAITPGADLGAITVSGELPASRTERWTRRLPWAVAGVMAVVAGIGFLRPAPETARSDSSVAKLPISVAPADSLATQTGDALAVSPDGSHLAYAAFRDDTSRLFLRSFGELEATEIAGTEGAQGPFFSPDGRWVGFFAGNWVNGGDLKKVALAGGTPQIIAEDVFFGGGSWGGNDTIVFGGIVTGLWRVPAVGGTPEQLAEAWLFDRELPENYLLWPQILPDGEHVLYTSYHLPLNQRAAVYSLRTGERTVLRERASHARYVASGHLVYSWDGQLLAAPFDVERLEIRGPSVSVQAGAAGWLGSQNAPASFDISRNGVLVFAMGEQGVADARLTWVDHLGQVEPLSQVPPAAYYAARISPDGSKVVVFTLEERFNLLLLDLERGQNRMLAGEDADDTWPLWTPDGSRVVFNSNRHGGPTMHLFSRPWDGSEPAELVAEMAAPPQPHAWTPDGSVLLFSRTDGSSFGIWELPFVGDRTPRPRLDTPANEFHPALSPDGRWLAYVSDEGGQDEVWVRAYPGPGPVRQVSSGGGWEPVWAPDGRQIFYTWPAGPAVRTRMMAATFRSGSPPEIGEPRVLFEGDYYHEAPFGRHYDISPDGQRFLMITSQAFMPAPTEIGVVMNWLGELEGRVGGER